MQNKFTIGQMAKLHNLPVKTLRYYDEIDLFKPIEVDPYTGYRYYSVEQFKVLDIINYLKVLGMPLKEIKHHITNRDISEFIDTLQKYKEKTEEKIKQFEMAKAKIEERIKDFQYVRDIEHVDEPFLQRMEERQVVQVKEKITSFYDLEISLRKLNQYFDHYASIFVGKVGLTISEESFEEGSVYDYNSIFLILEEVERGVALEHIDFVHTLPAGKYATIYFRGGHKDAKQYFDKLQQFIKQNDLNVKGNYIFRTIVDQFISKVKAEHLSEIQVLVENDRKKE